MFQVLKNAVSSNHESVIDNALKKIGGKINIYYSLLVMGQKEADYRFKFQQ